MTSIPQQARKPSRWEKPFAPLPLRRGKPRGRPQGVGFDVLVGEGR
jgi:hypothetical protein